MAIDFAPATPMDDQSAATSTSTPTRIPRPAFPPEALFGKPTQDIGIEYFADLFEQQRRVVPIWTPTPFDLVAVVDAYVSGHTIRFDIPLEALGGDDGSINTAHGRRPPGPSDWAPDVGHGTIEPFCDAPWLSASRRIPARSRRQFQTSR